MTAWHCSSQWRVPKKLSLYANPANFIYAFEPKIDYGLILQEGVTIVFGNNDNLEVLANNACRCIQMAKAGEISIYLGATKPLVDPLLFI